MKPVGLEIADRNPTDMLISRRQKKGMIAKCAVLNVRLPESTTGNASDSFSPVVSTDSLRDQAVGRSAAQLQRHRAEPLVSRPQLVSAYRNRSEQMGVN